MIDQDIGALADNWAAIDIRLASGFAHGPVIVEENTVTFSGAFGANASATYALKVRGSPNSLSVLANTFDGAMVLL